MLLNMTFSKRRVKKNTLKVSTLEEDLKFFTASLHGAESL